MNVLHTAHPDAIALTLGSVVVYWYGVIMAVAVLVGFIITLSIARKKQVREYHIYNLFFLLAFAGVIGGRIGHIIGEWQYYSAHPETMVRIWDGGLAFHGVLFACLIATAVYARMKRLSFWLITDVIVVSLPLMQAIGRWGNYFNQELYGTPTDAAWGIPIDMAHRLPGYFTVEYYHPLFLYESLFMLVVFGIIGALYRFRALQTGSLTLIYIMLFSSIRFCLDFLRIGMFSAGPLLLTQWLCIALLLGAGLLFALRLRKRSPEIHS
ncbi:MAG: prolipoprotein diacylglyceryl transferase [Patescibacteria group bacterium]|nr:prolipoprotein diacylglyceryl transferase [Patescibacteria group bacterium]MDD5715732.1 prolipoprotein diacylglyceryl transferase [Patescibacteria group bacterium]